MGARQVQWIVLAGLAVALVGELAFYLPQLPERLAVHFDLAGQANGWSGKFGLVVLLVVLTLVFASIFFGVGLLEKIPDRFINLPGKAHWLAPARREATFAWLREWLRWLLLAAMVLLVAVMASALQANLTTPPQLPALALWMLIAYVGVVALMIAILLRRFRARP